MEAFTDSQVIVNGKGLLKLLEYDRYSYQWELKLNKLGVQIDWGYGAPDIIEIVLDLLGFPEDQSLEDENGFCRDWLRDGPDFDRYKISDEEYLNWLFQQKKELFPD